jgi:hypothetical protein
MAEFTLYTKKAKSIILREENLGALLRLYLRHASVIDIGRYYGRRYNKANAPSY